jgi:hypothetical protein
MAPDTLAQRIADIRTRNDSRKRFRNAGDALLVATTEDIDLLLAELDRQGREIERLQAIEQAWHERFD